MSTQDIEARRKARAIQEASAVRKVQVLHTRFGMHPNEIAEKTKASVRQVYRWLAGNPPRTGALRTNIDAVYEAVAA